ncbi:hypothetical protein CWI36_0001p0030 [Hamiltosporidium magnivora]|uniref:Uncharacterized protein n=1 Tax=Hamiltosporidium magnivora TaxID=148818 RepID=A0A4Q9LP48_9MICR|nr:hypothetical protein CWI36_0001p0030 [Hamiltosporidium magnivora]
MNLHPGCKERFDLPRTELGRYLIIVELVEEVPKKNLEEAQVKKLYNKIEKQKQRQKLDSKLYNAKKMSIDNLLCDDLGRYCDKYNKSCLKRLEISLDVEGYLQSIVLKKTVETIFFDRRRELDSGSNAEGSWYRASRGVIKRAEMHEEPTLPLKQASRGEDFLEEPTINICEESEIEEETVVAKEVEENI